MGVHTRTPQDGGAQGLLDYVPSRAKEKGGHAVGLQRRGAEIAQVTTGSERVGTALLGSSLLSHWVRTDLQASVVTAPFLEQVLRLLLPAFRGKVGGSA